MKKVMVVGSKGEFDVNFEKKKKLKILLKSQER